MHNFIILMFWPWKALRAEPFTHHHIILLFIALPFSKERALRHVSPAAAAVAVGGGKGGGVGRDQRTWQCLHCDDCFALWLLRLSFEAEPELLSPTDEWKRSGDGQRPVSGRFCRRALFGTWLQGRHHGGKKSVIDYWSILLLSFSLVLPSCPSRWMCLRSRSRTTMAKSETTTTILTMTAGMTMSENQAADNGGTIVMRWDDPPWRACSFEASRVWIVELPWRLKLRQLLENMGA